VVKTFLIANLAVVSVWIGPTTPCRALPSGFSSTPASLLVLATTPSEPSPLSASLAMESFPATLVRRAGERYSHDAAARLRGARDGIISGPDASGCHGSRAAAGRPA